MEPAAGAEARSTTPGPLSRWRAPHRVLLPLLFLAALGLRLYQSTRPPMEFHPTRQYRSLIIARGFYFDRLTTVPDWERQVARCSQEKQGILEPPIMEAVVSTGYHLVGGERVWLPRLLSSLCWLIGGGVLFLIAKQLTDAWAALFATAFYLFLPFGVVASRSFQPDPLMVMLMLGGVWAILRYQAVPSRHRLAAAGALSAAAFLVKPGCVFVLLAVFVSLAIGRVGLRRAIRSPALAAFAILTIVPTLAIYAYGIATGAFLVNEATKTVLPQLWLTAFFWRGWLAQIGATVGFVCFITALLGILLFRPGTPRACVLGLWVGYVLFALVLNYNLATHDYYQLQLVPIVGLSLGPVAALVVSRIRELQQSFPWRLALWGTWGLAWLLSVADARARLVNSAAVRQVALQQEIGDQVRHSPRTLFLSGDYGVPLEYNGLLCGKSWPLSWDLEWERLAGRPVLPAAERFERRYAGDRPEYFIVEDLREFEAQPDLVRFLARFPVVARDDAHVIYDLGSR